MQNQNSSLPVKYEFDVANVMNSFFSQNKLLFFFEKKYTYKI